MGIKQVLKTKYSCWSELEKAIEQISDTTEKGDAFEQVCYFYFLYHKPLYQISEVYSPKIAGREIPKEIEDKLKLSHRDDGVDGVFVTTDGKCTAYQAKFRSNRRCPSSNELNNFWAEAEYADHRLVIANCPALPKDTGKRKSGTTVLVDRLDALGDDFFEYLYSVANGTEFEINTKKLSPMKFQEPIIRSAVKGFETVDRGKIIAACATGKTLISLWISEEMHAETVLFFAPNLSLIRQSIERWSLNANEKFQYLAVCSDNTVSSKLEDDLLTDLIDLDVPVTTDPEPIVKFLTGIKGKKVIFSTYQSVVCLIEALTNIPDFRFDLAVYDEAHRTAGRVEHGLFNLALSDSNIPVSKRLFMTATEKLIKPWIKDRLEQEEMTVFSMDDENIYGPTFYKFSFGEAIKQKIISDYKIVIAGISDSEIKELVDSNRYIRISHQDGSSSSTISADTLFKVMLLGKTVKETGMNKVVSFHSSVAAAKEFIRVIDKRVTAIKAAIEYQRERLPRLTKVHSQEELRQNKNAYMLLNQDSANLPIEDESIDLVLTDPPYGSNVQYGELSAFWLAWLYPDLGLEKNKVLDLSKEILVNRKKRAESKDHEFYYRGLLGVFKECYRVLKDGAPLVFTFNNKDPKVWMAVMKAALEAGFVLEDDGVIYQEPIENYINTAHTKYSKALLGDFIYTFLKDKRLNKIQNNLISEENMYTKIESTIDKKIADTVRVQASTTNEIYIAVFKQIIPLLASLAMEQRNFQYTNKLFKSSGIEDRIKKICTWDDATKKWRLQSWQAI